MTKPGERFASTVSLTVISSLRADAIQTQPAPENGAPSMSQAAAQSAIKKPAEDSLSPFSSDNEDAKPSKSEKASQISRKQVCLTFAVLIIL